MFRTIRSNARKANCHDAGALLPELTDRLLRDIGACPRSERMQKPLALRHWP